MAYSPAPSETEERIETPVPAPTLSALPLPDVPVILDASLADRRGGSSEPHFQEAISSLPPLPLPYPYDAAEGSSSKAAGILEQPSVAAQQPSSYPQYQPASASFDRFPYQQQSIPAQPYDYYAAFPANKPPGTLAAEPYAPNPTPQGYAYQSAPPPMPVQGYLPPAQSVTYYNTSTQSAPYRQYPILKSHYKPYSAPPNPQASSSNAYYGGSYESPPVQATPYAPLPEGLGAEQGRYDPPAQGYSSYPPPQTESQQPPPLPQQQPSTATYQRPTTQVRPEDLPDGAAGQQPSPEDRALSRVIVQDGNTSNSFSTADALMRYLRMYPEAANDQGCRAFRYGPNCPTRLLMPLFEHLDFSRFSQYPYGLLGNKVVSDAWGSGSCTCKRCVDGQLCGHYMLHKNFNFYLQLESTPSDVVYSSPKIETTDEVTSICFGTSRVDFYHADWNLQLSRFRCRTIETTLFAYDALVYQNYDVEVKARASPLDYIFQQLDYMLENWEAVLSASSSFLSSFRVEVLEERLETDRSIVRTLILAAQHWEEFRLVLKTQMQRIAFLRDVYGDPRWAEDRINNFETMAVANGYVQRFERIDFRISTELLQETDALIQRVTNLISIDEGYRSRDQNDSIRRLTWITFIFLPLLFTSALFSMQIDIFSTASPWHFYIYVSLVLMLLVFSGYGVLKSRRRMVLFSKAILLSLVAIPLGCITLMLQCSPTYRKETKTARDLEKQQKASAEETATMLKWAASSNNLQALGNIMHGEHGREGPGPDAFGVALIAAIQNNHVEAAKLIINNKEGLQYRDDEGAMPLHWAARRGHVSICHELLQLGVPLNEENAAGETALDWAMEGGDDATINFLLKGKKRYTRVDTLDMQSIHFSARMGDLEMVKSLYTKTKTLEMRDARGQTILFHAIKGKQLATVQWLLEEGKANVGAVDKEGLTALHVAADMSDADSAKHLIDHGANVNARSSLHLTPLHMITKAAGHLVLSLLVGHGASFDAECKSGDQPLHKAASAGEEGTPILKLLAQYGADLAAKGAFGNTAAHCAAACGCLKTLEVLVDESIDIKDCRNAAGYTPLIVAAQARAIDAMNYLLDKGASPIVSDAQGHSLVELSVGWGDPLVMSILQNHGAEFGDITDQAHPVWAAISDGQTRRAMEQLLDAGLSMEYAQGGVTLLQHALEAENTEVSTLLLERGASVDTKDRYGWSALHSAAFAGVIHPLQLVLQRVSDREPKDNQGWTSFDLAAFYGHKKAMSKLDPDGKIQKFAWTKDPDETTFWSQHSGVGVRDFAYSEAGFRERYDQGLVFEAPGD